MVARSTLAFTDHADGPAMTTVRELARDWLPPAVARSILGLRGKLQRYNGDHQSWAAAQAASAGYSASAILDRVLSATRTVVAGEAAYERDGVLFDEPDPPFSLLSALLRVAALQQGELAVVDFGGSLGSTYRQCRPLLEGLKLVDWTIIEQENFVSAGQEFASGELHFVKALQDIPLTPRAPVMLASSVLQYLEEPYAVLRQLAEVPGVRHMIIDRTPLAELPKDRLCVQHVPKHIYNASYPFWVLSRKRLLSTLGNRWRVVLDYLPLDGAARTTDGIPFEHRGLVLEKRE